MNQAILLLLLFCGIPNAILSQNLGTLKITPLTAPARNPVFIDFPEAAAIHISSAVPNLQMRTTLNIIADKSRPNEGQYIWLILPARQNITLSAAGFQSASITVAPSAAREVLYYRVEPVEAVPVSGRGNLVIRSDPPGARVIVDGFPDMERTTPANFVNYAAQPYFIRIEADKHETQSFVVSIKPGETLVKDVALVPTYGFLSIEEAWLRDPKRGDKRLRALELTMKINGITQPLRYLERIELPVGVHNVVVSGSNMLDYSSTVKITPGATSTLIPELKPAERNYTVTGAQGVALFKTDANKSVEYLLPDQASSGASYTRNFSPGTYRVAVSDGPFKRTIRFTIKKDEVTEYFIPLKPERERAFVYNLFPGGGQHYIKKKRGYVYTVLGLAAAGVTAYSYSQFKKHDIEVQTAMERYKTATSEADIVRYRADAEAAIQLRDDAKSLYQTGLLALGGVYALSYFDLLVSRPSIGWQRKKDRDRNFRYVYGASNVSATQAKLAAVIPGAGHILMGHERGWLYMAGATGAALVALNRHNTIKSAQSDIALFQKQYSTAVREQDILAARTSLVAAQQRESEAITDFNNALVAGAAIWGWSFLDALVSKPAYGWKAGGSKKLSARVIPSYDPVAGRALASVRVGF